MSSTTRSHRTARTLAAAALMAGAALTTVSFGTASVSADGPPCTGTNLDQIVGPYLGADCGGGNGGQPGTDPGDPQSTPPSDPGGTPPPPGI
jgi:hypothetical protein